MPSIDRELLACLPDLRAYARSLTRHAQDADDLVQDVIVRLLQAADRYQPGTNFKAWAFTVLRNRFINEFVAKRRHVRPLEDGDADRMLTRASQADALELADFRRVFAQLPPDYREVLTLVSGSGLGYEDVAKILGCALGTVKSRVHRARAALLDRLAVAQSPVPTPAAQGPDARKARDQTTAGLLAVK
jgi:RNA polymerase sigma-70 factor (ECF subfamily)